MKVTKPASTALYPVPAVLVTCGVSEPNIITLAWVGILCSDPPTLGISIRPNRHSYQLIEKQGEFVVNVPRADQVAITDYCGQVSGRDVNKWAACSLSAVPATKVETPIIAECPVALECQVREKIEIGAHHLFIGEVVAVQVDEDLLDGQGHIDYERAQPLGYGGGRYFKMSKVLGTFGDWRKGIG